MPRYFRRRRCRSRLVPAIADAIGAFSQAVIRFQVDLVGLDAISCKDFA